MSPGRIVDVARVHQQRSSFQQRAAAFIFAACFCLAARPTAAATIVVTSTADTRADDGVCTLREAVLAANLNTASGFAVGECVAGSALPTIDIIELSNVSGSPDLFTMAIAGRDEDVATTGDLDLTESVTVRGQSMAETIVQAGTSTVNGVDRVFDVVQGGAAIAVAFENMTIRHGRATVPAGGVAASAQGGGLYVRAVASGLASAITVTDASITLNTAAGNGGGIAVAGGFGAIAPSLTLLRADVSSNTASLGGGGILCSACTLTITNSSVLSNLAQVTGGMGYGGGGLRMTGDGLSSTISNSTIGDNTTNTDGGGAVIPVGTVSATFTFVTLYANRADLDANTSGIGGALRNVSGAMQVDRSIIAGNLRAAATASDCSGTVTSVGYNVLGIAGGCITGGTATVTTSDAKLSALDFHGGTTRNYAPIVASPALARIAGAQCPTATDQRGFVRPVGASCESGAIENSRPTVIANNASMNEDGGPTGFPFTVSDYETPDTLIVTATSSVTGLVPNANIGLTGSGVNRTLTATPLADQFGGTDITVSVNDGDAQASDPFLLTVLAVNDAPTLAALPTPVTLVEDAAAQTVNLGGISAGGGESQALTVTATSDNTAVIPHPTPSYTSASATGSIGYTPAANASGSATITVTVTDDGSGGINNFSRSFVVNVTSVNDAPTLTTLPTPLTVLEDAAAQIVNLSGISAGGGESQTLAVTATSDNTALIPHPALTYTSADTTGSIGYTPAANASGSATITVTVTDSGGGTDSVARSFVVNVTAVNDAPTLNSGNNASILRDAGIQTVNLSGITAGGGETGQTLAVTATSNHPGLIPHPSVTYTSPESTGSLGYAPVAAATGQAMITVTVTDDGGGTNTASHQFMVTVRAPFTDHVLVAGAAIKVAHITELRARINTLRERHNLSLVTWTDPSLVAGVTQVRTQHLTELREGLLQAYDAAARARPIFSDATLTATQTVILGVHIAELRDALVAIED